MTLKGDILLTLMSTTVTLIFDRWLYCLAFSWVTTPESSLSWNWQRGAIAGVIGAAFVGLFLCTA